MDQLFEQLRISEVEKYPEIITNYAKEDEEFREDMEIWLFMMMILYRHYMDILRKI